MMISIMIGTVFLSLQFHFHFHSTISPIGLKWSILLIFIFFYYLFLSLDSIRCVLPTKVSLFIRVVGTMSMFCRRMVNLYFIYVVCSVFVLRRQRKTKYKYLISKKNPPNVGMGMEHGIRLAGKSMHSYFYIWDDWIHFQSSSFFLLCFRSSCRDTKNFSFLFSVFFFCFWKNSKISFSSVKC